VKNIPGQTGHPWPHLGPGSAEVTALSGYVRLKFTKNGLDRVNIYSRLKGQPGWAFLSRDTNSPYGDHKALGNGAPETREYMCIGVMEDTEVGQQSDIVTVGFGG
jgi:hypothetical protein